MAPAAAERGDTQQAAPGHGAGHGGNAREGHQKERGQGQERAQGREQVQASNHRRGESTAEADGGSGSSGRDQGSHSRDSAGATGAATPTAAPPTGNPTGAAGTATPDSSGAAPGPPGHAVEPSASRPAPVPTLPALPAQPRAAGAPVRHPANRAYPAHLGTASARGHVSATQSAAAPSPQVLAVHVGQPSDFGRTLERATGAVGRVARRVPGAAAFPLGLLALVGGFLLVQHFIDRGDPKLALAPSSSQTRRQFGPPPAANPA